uniref:Ig-like domain-containing protein n=1 Tax=Spermophilus dauricus TaxID=99837 RepID=A0A8C9Q5C2_SPEDA
MNLSGSLITKMTHISFFPLGRTHGQSMTQMEGQQTMSEGSILIINCTYSSSGYAHLFWYVQYPGDGPQLLLKAMKANDKGREKGFEATYKKETTSFHLEKASIQESDSAVYYCALSDTVAETAGGSDFPYLCGEMAPNFKRESDWVYQWKPGS